MGKLVDMAVLTGLWLLCSLPVITVGASTSALFYVTLKLARNQEGYTVSSFFKAFKANMKQGLCAGLIGLALSVFLACDLYCYYQMGSRGGTVLFCIFLTATLLCLMVFTYLFPLMARCEADLKKLFMMAFVMSVRNFGWTLLMIVAAVCILAIGLFVAAPLLMVGAGLAAYIDSLILNQIFAQYHLDLA